MSKIKKPLKNQGVIAIVNAYGNEGCLEYNSSARWKDMFKDPNVNNCKCFTVTSSSINSKPNPPFQRYTNLNCSAVCIDNPCVW